jgi:hypothetical protein
MLLLLLLCRNAPVLCFLLLLLLLLLLALQLLSLLQDGCQQLAEHLAAARNALPLLPRQAQLLQRLQATATTS